jgi:hypothetical protein
MAEKRMFAKSIVDSDAFLDMPLSSQALYFHLGMRADDDGFINSAKKIQRMIGSADDDLRILIAKNFVIPFEDGVCVIKHWKIHNLIQKDRYKPTLYTDHFTKISLKNNKVYSMESQCIQDVSIVETICTPRLGKVRLEKTITPDGFDVFWNSYPKKKSKGDALKAWKKLNPSLELQTTIYSAIDRLQITEDWKKQNGQFIPYPATWLNAMGWEDQITATPVANDFYSKLAQRGQA